MTSEEVHLNAALRAADYEVVESDLGEYFVELAGGGPYHFVFPSMHLTRGEISALFEKELGTPPTNDPEELDFIGGSAEGSVSCKEEHGHRAGLPQTQVAAYSHDAGSR